MPNQEEEPENCLFRAPCFYDLCKGFLKVGNNLFLTAHDAVKPYFAVLGSNTKGFFNYRLIIGCHENLGTFFDDVGKEEENAVASTLFFKGGNVLLKIRLDLVKYGEVYNLKLADTDLFYRSCQNPCSHEAQAHEPGCRLRLILP